MIVAIDFVGFTVVTFINTTCHSSKCEKNPRSWRAATHRAFSGSCVAPAERMFGIDAELALPSLKVANPKNQPSWKTMDADSTNGWFFNMRTGKPQIKFRFLGLILWLLHLCCLLGIMVMYIHSCDRVSVREILLHPAFVCIGLIECIFAFEKAGFANCKDSKINWIWLFQFCGRDACYRLWIMSGMSNYFNVGVLGGPRCCWASVGTCVVGAAQCHTVDNKALSKIQVTCLI